MAGILDSKTRIMDIIITEEGKRQAAQGELRIKYASFTDRHTFYQEDPNNPGVAEDHSNRIFFEAMSKDQDRIVVETEELYSLDGAPTGRLLPFKAKDMVIQGGTIVSGTISSVSSLGQKSEYVAGQLTGSIILTGSDVLTAASGVLDSITNHFKDQMIIGDRDPFSDTQGFEVTAVPGQTPGSNYHNGMLTFSISDFSPFHVDEMDVDPVSSMLTGKAMSLESSDSFYTDKKLQHLPNFMFLPPVNERLPSEKIPTKLGRYPNIQQNGAISLQDLEAELESKPYIDVDFTVTSRDNNIMTQAFEFAGGNVRKLSIIDFGEFSDEDPLSPGKRVYYVGKIYRDVLGHLTFVNMFTVVYD